MSENQTPAMVAEVVRCVRDMSSRAVLSAEEREFVNEQAARVSEQMMQIWAAQRYKGRKKLRPCCVGLALALAMDVAHKMSLPGEALSAGQDNEPSVAKSIQQRPVQPNLLSR